MVIAFFGWNNDWRILLAFDAPGNKDTQHVTMRGIVLDNKGLSFQKSDSIPLEKYLSNPIPILYLNPFYSNTVKWSSILYT